MFDIITIGTATRDTFLVSPKFRRVNDPKHLRRLGFPTGEAECFPLGAKMEVGAPVLTVGGGAANAAVTFARQGLKTATIAKIGRDEYGRAVVADLRREHVAALTTIDPDAPTASSVILVTPSGERTILNYRGASEDLTLRDVPFRRLKARFAYIVPGRIPLPVIRGFVERLKRQGARIAMNPSKYYLELGSRRLAPILSALDVVTLNREEAAGLTGKRYDDEAGIFRAFDKLVPGIAVMTDGAKGVAVSDGHMVYRAGVFRERAMVDRTGAGDAFGSGFVAGLIRYGSGPKGILESIRLASANATAVVESLGAQAGILSRRAFAADPRWRTLRITQKKNTS